MKLRPRQDQLDWISKEAFAAPMTEKQEKALGNQGLVQIPDVRNKYPKGNVGGRKGSWGYKDIIKEVGAEDLFETSDPKLRTWLKLNADKIVVIEGQEYIVWNTKKPNKKSDLEGKILAVGPLVRDAEGKIDSEKSSFKPKEFSYAKYAEQMQTAPDILKKKLDEANVEIQSYNNFVDKTVAKMEEGKGASVTVLPLQLKHAEGAIERRLSTLAGQKKSIEEGLAKTQEQAQAGMQALNETSQEGLSPQDYAILLLEQKFHSVATLQQLKGEIANVQMPFDQETNTILQNFIVSVVDWQLVEREKEIQKREEAGQARTERKEEEDLPEMKQMLLQKVAPLEKLKGAYKKVNQFYSPEAMTSQRGFTTETIDQDYSELSAVLGSIQQARESIIALPSKTNAFITGEGAYRLQEIESFVNNADLFVKRYQTNPFVETEAGLEINNKLLGTSGTLGNSIVAMALRQIILSVNAEIERIKTGTTPPQAQDGKVEMVKEPITEPTVEPVREPTNASKKNNMERLSEIFWQSFEEGMRLK